MFLKVINILNFFVCFGVQKLNICIVKIIDAYVKVIDMSCSELY